MNLGAEIRAAEANPQQLEQLYQAAKQEGQTDGFQTALLASYETSPDNLLYAAWFYRLKEMTNEPVKPRRSVNWITAIPLIFLTAW